MDTRETYDRKTIIFHWLCAAIIPGLWIAGQSIDFFATGNPRVMVRSLHISFGVILAFILIGRVRWRLGGGARFPQVVPGAFGKLATGTHHLLYLTMALVVIVGISAVWIRGDSIFNLIRVPAFDPANKQLRKDVVELHGLLANSLLIVAGLHTLIAIWHHLVRKDAVLTRMWPRARG